MNHWLVKSEPDVYSWDKLVREGRAMWDGVRNYQARNNLKAMKKRDRVLFYHSGAGPEIVGLAVVEKESYPDPTAKEPGWVAVDLAPQKPFTKPVSLKTVKNDIRLKDLLLVRHSRLSVMPVPSEEYKILLSLAE